MFFKETAGAIMQLLDCKLQSLRQRMVWIETNCWDT